MEIYYQDEDSMTWDENSEDEMTEQMSIPIVAPITSPITTFKPMRPLACEPLDFCQYDDSEPKVESDESPKPTRTRRDSHEVALDKRLASCGSFRKHFNLNQGIYVSYRVRCMRKDCPECGQLLGYLLKKRVIWCSKDEMPEEREQQEIYVLEISHDIATVLRRKLGRTNYLNVPQENGIDILFIDVNNIDNGMALVEQYHGKHIDDTNYDWAALQRTPVGMNISGQLNRQVRDTSNLSEELIILPQITITEQGNVDVDALGIQAALETVGELPESYGQLQHSIAVRSNRLLDLLDANDVKYTITYVKRHYRVDELDWKVGIAYLFNMLMRAKYDELKQSLRDLLDYAKKNTLKIQEIFGETYNKYFPKLMCSTE